MLPSSVTYLGILEVDGPMVDYLPGLLASSRAVLGTRKGRPSPVCAGPAVVSRRDQGASVGPGRSGRRAQCVHVHT